MKVKYIVGVFIIIMVGVLFLLLPQDAQYHSVTSNVASQSEYYYNNDVSSEDSLLPNDLNSILSERATVPLDTNPTSITVLVNRSYLLPSSYIPRDLTEPSVNFAFHYNSEKRKLRKEAADALEDLFHTGINNGVVLYGVSGYRSYTRQKQIYDNNVRSRGSQATDSVSAKPGSSEHQTGLSIDVSAKSVGCRLDQALGNTTEGKWLAKNAHRFGFIIRYPKGKEDITGYTYEPWHIRYVGKTVATYLYKNKLTLEDYYGTTCDEKSGAAVTGVDVENADTVKYSTPKPTKKAKPSASPSPTPKKKDDKKTEKKKDSKKKPKKTPKPIVRPTHAAPTAVPAVPEPTIQPQEPVVEPNTDPATPQ